MRKGRLYPALLFLACSSWASPGIYIINDVTGGRNTTDDAYNIKANETQSSKNTLIDKINIIREDVNSRISVLAKQLNSIRQDIGKL